jgi:hypothetical protein
MRNVSEKCVEKIKTHILCSINFFSRKSCCVRDNVEKHCIAGQATDDNMAHAHCMPDSQGRLHTHTGFLPESDPAPFMEFFTRTGITAAGGQFDFERCTRKMFVHRNRKSTP